MHFTFTVIATIFYVVDLVHADGFIRITNTSNIRATPAVQPHFKLRSKRWRLRDSPVAHNNVESSAHVVDKEEDADVESKKKKNVTNGNKKEEPAHLTESPTYDTSEEEDPKSFSGNAICAELQQECYKTCEYKRDMCEEWRGREPVD